VRMPGGGGPVLTRRLVEATPPTRVIALSACEDQRSVSEMFRAGATSYLVKGASARSLVASILESDSGTTALSHGLAVNLIAELVAMAATLLEDLSDANEMVALSDVLTDVEQEFAADGGRVQIEVSPGVPPVRGRRDLLARAVDAVVENALGVAASGGPVDIR